MAARKSIAETSQAYSIRYADKFLESYHDAWETVEHSWISASQTVEDAPVLVKANLRRAKALNTFEEKLEAVILSGSLKDLSQLTKDGVKVKNRYHLTYGGYRATFIVDPKKHELLFATFGHHASRRSAKKVKPKSWKK